MGRLTDKYQKTDTSTAPQASAPPPSSQAPGESGFSTSEPMDYQGLRATKLRSGAGGSRVLKDLGGDEGDFIIPTHTPLKGNYAGKALIDTTAMRRDLANVRLAKRVEAARAAGTPVSTTDRRLWRNEELQTAHGDLLEWQREQRSTSADVSGVTDMATYIWMDKDPGDVGATFRSRVGKEATIPFRTDHLNPAKFAQLVASGEIMDIQKQNTAAAFERVATTRLVAPLAASVMGVNQYTYDGPKSESYNEGDTMGGLDYYGRFQASTYIAAAAKASGVEHDTDFLSPTTWANMASVWGTPEHLEIIQEGEDVVSLADDLGLGDHNPTLLLGKVLIHAGIITDQTNENFADFAAGLSIAIADPFDLFAVATMGFGKLAKLGKLSKLGDVHGMTTVGKHLTKKKVLNEVADSVLSAEAEASRLGPEDGARASEMVREVMGSLREGGVALPGVVELQVQAMLHSTAPLSREAYSARARSVEAMKSLSDKFLDPAMAAGESAARLTELEHVGRATKATKKEVSAAEAIARLDVAKLQHMADEMAYQDMRAHRKTLGMLSQKLGPTASKVDPQVLGDTLEASVKSLDEARNTLAQAFAEKIPGGTGPVEEVLAAAIQQYDEANVIYQRAAYDISVAMGDAAVARLDKLLDISHKNAKQSFGLVAKTARDAGKYMDPKEARKAGQAHAKAIKGVSSTGELRAGRAALAAIAKATRDLAVGYGKLADLTLAVRDKPEGFQKVLDAADAGDPLLSLAKDAERVAHELRYQDLGPGLTGKFLAGTMKINDYIGDFINPRIKAFGTTSEVLQRVAQSAEGELGLGMTDILTLGRNAQIAPDVLAGLKATLKGPELKAAIDAAQDAAVRDSFTRYVTSVEAVGPRGRQTLLNTINGEETLWDLAKPILRHMADEGPGSSKVFEAMTNAWLPSKIDHVPLDAAKHIVAIRQKSANLILHGDTAVSKGSPEKARNLTLERYLDGMRKATAKIVGVSEQTLLKQEGKQATSNIVRAVMEASSINRAARAATRITGDLSPETARAVELIATGQGHRAGDSFLQAMQVFDVLNIPSNQRRLMKGVFKETEAGLLRLGGQQFDKAEKAFDKAAQVFKAAEERLAAAVKSGKIPNIRAAEKNLDRVRPVHDAAKATHTQAMLDLHLIPNQFIMRMDDKVGKIIKSIESHEPAHPGAERTAAWALRMWNTSLLTGVMLPRASYYTNIYMGNFAQMWTETNLATAAKVTMETLPYLPMEAAHHIPFLGKFADAARLKMAEQLGVDVDGVLPSITQVFINPHIARFFDPGLAKNTDKVNNKFNQQVTYGDLRKWAVEQGILTSFAKTSGLQDVVRRTDHYTATLKYWEKTGQKMSDLRGAYTDIADTIEQRQRVALFTDLIINKGMSPEQAGRKVNNALYDWTAPSTAHETQYISKMFMFWNFSKKALGQGFRNLTDGFVQAPEHTALENFIRNNSFLAQASGKEASTTAKLRDLFKQQQAAKEFMRTNEADIEARENPALRGVYPWWAARSGSQTFLTNAPMSVHEIDYNKSLGRDVTHRALTMSSYTPLEYSSLWLDTFKLLVAATSLNQEVGTMEALQEIGMEGARMGGKVTGPAMEAALEETFGKEGISFGTDRSTVKVKRLSDRLLLGALQKVLPADTFMSPDGTGAMRVDRQTMGMFKMVLPLSHEVSGWLDPILENRAAAQYIADNNLTAEEAKDIDRGLKWMVGQWLGVGKARYHDPGTLIKYDDKELKRRVTGAKKDAKDVYHLKETDNYGRPISKPRGKPDPKDKAARRPTTGKSSKRRRSLVDKYKKR